MNELLLELLTTTPVALGTGGTRVWARTVVHKVRTCGKSKALLRVPRSEQ